MAGFCFWRGMMPDKIEFIRLEGFVKPIDSAFIFSGVPGNAHMIKLNIMSEYKKQLLDVQDLSGKELEIMIRLKPVEK
jgi:hypothetical protein